MTKFKKRMRPLLGTYVEIGAHHDEKKFEYATSEAFTVIELVQNLLSFQDSESELTKLNKSSYQNVNLHPITITALRLARKMTGLSRGLFDFTVGGLLVEQGVLPNHDFKNKIIPFGDPQDLAICGYTARLKRPILLTLDGIAKGYAVDLAIKKLKDIGVRSGWVNAGGDLRIFGNISLPIHRRELSGELKLLGIFNEISLATSFISHTADLRFPGQIVSSQRKKLWPGVWSVTAPTAWLADALTKVASVSIATECEANVKMCGGKLLNTEVEL